MTPPLNDILEAYLEARKEQRPNLESLVKKLLRERAIPEDQLDILLLKMDDAWTSEKLLLLKTKKAQFRILAGLFLAGIGAAVTLLSFVGLFLNGQLIILWYGAVASGIIAFLVGKKNLAVVAKERAARKRKWNRMHW